MIAGFPYSPLDATLVEERTRARALMKKFNSADAGSAEHTEIIKELFHPSCRGKTLFIEPMLRVDYGYNISMGNNVVMNFNCVILDCAPVSIGDDSMFAPGVQIYAATHPLSPKHRKLSGNQYYELAFPVKIGSNVWVGGNAVILPGVVIGDNAVIGAGSVVTRDVPPNVVVAGNPAKVIREINE